MAVTEARLPEQLAGLFARLAPEAAPTVAPYLARLVSANQAGHVCLALPPAEARRLARARPLVGQPGEAAPLILDGARRLYFARHWRDEATLADRLAALAADTVPLASEAARRVLDALFPPRADGKPDRQKLAAALALRKRFTVISGGPGTGKTTTVVRLMAAVASLAPRPLAIAMAAPTGKAAARLTESVRLARAALPVPEEIRAQLPSSAQTLHRLIGLVPGQAAPRHHAGHPLPLDLLVVDEASMVDLSLMSRTLAALPPSARLVLLGDRDQLASVDAGAVLADLCSEQIYGADTLAWLQEAAGHAPFSANLDPLPALADCVALLTESHRFGADSGIGALARAVNGGNSRAALSCLDDLFTPDIGWGPEREALAAELLARREAYFAALEQGPAVAFAAFGRFMLLAAERRDVAALNEAVEARLARAGRKRHDADWYAGRPVMIRENDYAVGLFNGDIGLALPSPDGLRVWFPTADGGYRALAPGRLPPLDTVYAMTVHKSQGSEFDEVWMLLPGGDSQVLDRALLYTAITRAKREFRLCGEPATLSEAVGRVLPRHSGLAERLWATAG
ncbi:exodeoxyribonuclease V subunit alpha [Crenobacter sp. SG2303]|uniref:RecBCD enzyme subunit RecD n=1 Tax=Crenobacter oryzisoli TaxID=3056844 RepID=A0ABT7XME4_9NEIS|nr:exodeoxyribonuclease V subunit alpha [Crenobacter sp. SG2303]MDN0074858.1 exodeoxyribonuclease V subunit alpha [Crenobacter sp. SG2303]